MFFFDVQSRTFSSVNFPSLLTKFPRKKKSKNLVDSEGKFTYEKVRDCTSKMYIFKGGNLVAKNT